MPAAPLLSVFRYSALSAGYVYGFSRLQYLKGKDTKYRADLASKPAAVSPHH